MVPSREGGRGEGKPSPLIYEGSINFDLGSTDFSHVDLPLGAAVVAAHSRGMRGAHSSKRERFTCRSSKGCRGGGGTPWGHERSMQ